VLLLGGLLANGKDVSSLKPPAPQELEKSIGRGLEFLLKDQNKDGSWGSAHRTKDLNIYAPVPAPMTPSAAASRHCVFWL